MKKLNLELDSDFSLEATLTGESEFDVEEEAAVQTAVEAACERVGAMVADLLAEELAKELDGMFELELDGCMSEIGVSVDRLPN